MVGCLVVTALSVAVVGAQGIERVSVSTGGVQGNGASSRPVVSTDGRYVAFSSDATNLVPGDTNNHFDAFVRDRQTEQTIRVSVATGGDQGNRDSFSPSISADGLHVACHSLATNLIPVDTNGYWDVFVRDWQTGQTTCASRATSGRLGNGGSQGASISADGRYVAFFSSATNLVVGDTNKSSDVFVHDRQTGQTARVSVTTGGAQGNELSQHCSISADGRYVAFESNAINLVRGDTNGRGDIFVHDRQTGRTTRVSVATGGAQGNDHSGQPAISADGRYIAFRSRASNLAAGDANGDYDIFVHDRKTGQTARVSVATGGAEANFRSSDPSISADGRYVAFSSSATNLVVGDTNKSSDVFVHDRQTGQTARVSVTTGGAQANELSARPSISGDGRHVAFGSPASNLVAGDTNGKWDAFIAGNPLHERAPILSWVGVGGFANDGVGPDTGEPGGSFRFRVKLTDLNGDEPDFVRLILRRDGAVWRTPSMSPESAGPTYPGRVYRVSLTLPAGNYAYRFRAKDQDGVATGDPTKLRVGPLIDSPPYLAWTGAQGYKTDGCQPESGVANSTRFRFKVLCTDHEGDMPTYVRLILRRNGAAYHTFAMLPAGTAPDPAAGIVYRYARRLPAGNYSYRIRAKDDDGVVLLPSAGRIIGPKVSASASAAALTGLAAVPTTTGAQITFTLSSAAQVEARVLNIAGRPVATLCRARDCESGTNTLLWDARSDAGLPVPNGTYLIEVAAKAEDGTQTRALGRVSLNR